MKIVTLNTFRYVYWLGLFLFLTYFSFYGIINTLATGNSDGWFLFIVLYWLFSPVGFILLLVFGVVGVVINIFFDKVSNAKHSIAQYIFSFVVPVSVIPIISLFTGIQIYLCVGKLFPNYLDNKIKSLNQVDDSAQVISYKTYQANQSADYEFLKDFFKKPRSVNGILGASFLLEGVVEVSFADVDYYSLSPVGKEKAASILKEKYLGKELMFIMPQYEVFFGTDGKHAAYTPGVGIGMSFYQQEQLKKINPEAYKKIKEGKSYYVDNVSIKGVENTLPKSFTSDKANFIEN